MYHVDQLALLAVICTGIMSTGLLIAVIVLCRREAVNSEYLSRIDTWAVEMLRALDPDNPRIHMDSQEVPTKKLVWVDQLDLRGLESQPGPAGTFHSTPSDLPERFKSGSGPVEARGLRLNDRIAAFGFTRLMDSTSKGTDNSFRMYI